MRGSHRLGVVSSVALAGALVVLAGACAEPAPGATGPRAEPVAAVTSLVVGPTLNRSIDRDLVTACIDRVQFGAYAQDPELMAMWAEAGRDIDGLERLCETLGIDDPAALQALADEWEELQRVFVPAFGSTSTSSTVPGAAPRTTVPAGRPTATTPATGPVGVTTTIPVDATSPPAPAPTCGPGEAVGPDGACIPAPADPPATPAPTAPTAPPAPAPEPPAPAPTT